MPFWRLYYHLVWATRNRELLITPTVEPKLYAYIISKAAELELYVYAINGCSDHVHLLVAIPPKHAVADVVKNLKGASAHYINHHLNLEYTFGWQRGYGALSLGERQRDIAESYIRRQKQHHGENSVNAWLERDADFDEGPPDTGVGVTNQLREPGMPYAIDDYPF